MAPKLISRALLGMAAGFIALAMAPAAYAQDSFAGNWKIVEIIKPDWTEPTAEPQEKPMAVGDVVDIQSNQIVANGAFNCATASYQVVKIDQVDLFQKSINGAAKAAAVASQFNIGGNALSLKVDCNNGMMFDFHQVSDNRIVSLVDSLVYTLERTR